jgi:hypothetical protein
MLQRSLTVVAEQRSPKPNRISYRITCQPPAGEIEKCDQAERVALSMFCLSIAAVDCLFPEAKASLLAQ